MPALPQHQLPFGIGKMRSCSNLAAEQGFGVAQISKSY
jgi:hypothetical protein